MKRFIAGTTVLLLFLGCEATQKRVDLDLFQQNNAQLAHIFAQEEYKELISFDNLQETSLCQLLRNNCPGGVCYPNRQRSNVWQTVRPQYNYVSPPVVQRFAPNVIQEYIVSPVEETVEETVEEKVTENVEAVQTNGMAVISNNVSGGSNGNWITTVPTVTTYGSNGSFSGYSYSQSYGSYGSQLSNPYGNNVTYRSRGELVRGQPVRNLIRRIIFWR